MTFVGGSCRNAIGGVEMPFGGSCSIAIFWAGSCGNAIFGEDRVEMAFVGGGGRVEILGRGRVEMPFPVKEKESKHENRCLSYFYTVLIAWLFCFTAFQPFSGHLMPNYISKNSI